jgi:hypothetical protein
MVEVVLVTNTGKRWQQYTVLQRNVVIGISLVILFLIDHDICVSGAKVDYRLLCTGWEF